MNEKNIEAIKVQLLSLGLGPEIEYDLRGNICLQPDHFQISHRLLKEADIMNCIFYFEREENEYYCRYYEACLRKKISLPAVLLNDVDVNELKERMGVIDWNNVLANNPGNKVQVDRPNWQKEEAIESIVTDLKKLSVTLNGLHLAERLKIKFWMDTPLVSIIPNISVLKNQYEISQRFYFFEGEEQISLDEAYRFLSHRWREKQLNAKKKQENMDGSENGSSAVGTLKENKLLTKRGSNKRKQHKL